jgi:hypothetical protein
MTRCSRDGDGDEATNRFYEAAANIVNFASAAAAADRGSG